jgi:hypothetical protein
MSAAVSKAESARIAALHADNLTLGGTPVTATAADLNRVSGINVSLSGLNADAADLNLLNGISALAGPVIAEEIIFTETAGAGTYTGSVILAAGCTLLDIIVNGVALWTATTSATLVVGDADTADGFFTGVNLKATDLLAGESLSFSEAGGKAGSYIANSQVSPRYNANGRTISAVVTTVGAAGEAGRTRVLVVYARMEAAKATAATKA